ncbi:PH domain-containing protein [Actinoplanes couchii]|nr:PH domain-containing protein [Actinoplanes couchii]MDR6322803.1 hypothetical protein [Actinoplanes couchii]
MNAVAGLLPGFPALAVLAGETPLPDWSGSVLVAAAATLGLRGYRLRADCEGGRVTVRGWFRNRTIPCAAIIRLDRGMLPGITWQDTSGREHHTALRAFRRNPQWPSHDPHHEANLRRLARYIKAHRGRPGR